MDHRRAPAGPSGVDDASLGRTGPALAPDDYEAFQLLAPTGGQGYVFRARLVSDRLGPGLAGTEVSLKQLITGAIGVGRIERFHREIVGRTHPNLSRQLEIFTGAPVGGPDDEAVDDLIYVAAAWVPGDTIDEAAEGRPLSRRLRWISQIAAAVDFLHAEVHDTGPVLHRDIKPSNVIVDTRDHAVLIDPGLARPLAAGATGTPYGSPGYQPPETRRSFTPGGAAADRWQLGALIYALIVGDPPGGDDPDRLRTKLTSALEATHRPTLLVDAITAMLDPDPDNRPASAADWASTLETGEVQSRRPDRRRRRRTVGLRVGVLAGLVAAGGIGFAVHPSKAAETTPAGSGGGFLPVDSRVVNHATRASRPVTVDNKVTNGPTAMREDSPAYLSTRPEDFCIESGCALPDTKVGTGTELTAVCQTVGENTTNGDNQTAVDADNPGRASSDLWYGIRLRDGRFGYLSVVWLAVEDRGGLGLTQC